MYKSFFQGPAQDLSSFNQLVSALRLGSSASETVLPSFPVPIDPRSAKASPSRFAPNLSIDRKQKAIPGDAPAGLTDA